MTIAEFYNSEIMQNLRQELLNGVYPKACKSCHYEDSVNKINGRRKNLIKSGITLDNFEFKMRSSPHYDLFKDTYLKNGYSNYMPVDLQLDLSNVCNSSCIMCYPNASSKLFNEYKTLSKLNPEIFSYDKNYKNWTKDSNLVDRVVDEIGELKELKFIQFIGGETLLDKTFYKICDKLIEKGLAKNITLGTTTNGTIYSEKIEHYIKNFKQFHLGISVETFTDLNDYVRYPSKIADIKENIKKFIALRDNSELYLVLRITPSLFSIYELDTVFEFMIENKLIAEACNILADPIWLKIELLPEDIRQEIIKKIEKIIAENNLVKNTFENVRNKHKVDEIIATTIIEYYDFLKNYKIPDNIEHLRKGMVNYIKSFEAVHNNRITDYVPRYTEFLRNYGY